MSKIYTQFVIYVEDGLLVLLSIVLFAVLYLMINPGMISLQTIGKAVYIAKWQS